MLGLAKRTRARIFHASTSEVYGDPLEHPQKETYVGAVNPIGPRACYDEGKRIAEALFFDYHRQHDVDIKVARIFNTYGPRMNQHDGRVVSNFVVQALKGEDITVHGDGGQTRSFCYVDDLIRGIVCCHRFAARLHRSGQSRQSRRVHDPANLPRSVIDMTGSRSKIVRTPLPVDDPKRRCPDIALAKKALGWEPKIKLKEGLEKTIAFFEQELSLAHVS